MNRVGTGLLGGSSFTSSRFGGRTRTAGFVIVKAIFVGALIVSLVESLLWTFLEYDLFKSVKLGADKAVVISLWWITLFSLCGLSALGLIASFKEHFKMTALFVLLMLLCIVGSNCNPYVTMNPVTNVTNTAVLLIGLTYAVYVSSEDREGRTYR
ncbi:hypothetical protein HDE_07759 [Halotydeus destructor]|nr:hypothetical protein HDE_07759 [Halotydeus destructor]